MSSLIPSINSIILLSTFYPQLLSPCLVSLPAFWWIFLCLSFSPQVIHHYRHKLVSFLSLTFYPQLLSPSQVSLQTFWSAFLRSSFSPPPPSPLPPSSFAVAGPRPSTQGRTRYLACLSVADRKAVRWTRSTGGALCRTDVLLRFPAKKKVVQIQNRYFI